MDSSDCLVCSIKSTCTEDSIYLYAPTEILAHRLKLVLDENQVQFALHHQTFALTEKVDREKLLHTLRTQLSNRKPKTCV